MKLIKKIAAIMFAFMMVFSLSTNVKAKTGSQTASPKGGSITINKTIKDQDYKIYKIFELESFNTEPAPDGVYSYKITDDWREFFTNGDGQTYVTEENGYVKSNITDSNVAEFTKKALAYTKNITATRTVKGNGSAVPVNDLDFGYYLVDSTAGALCGLTTTNPNVTIDEKNEKPKVDKYVSLDTGNVKKNNVSIGDSFMYETIITIGKGAKNFVLYDKLPQGLTLDTNHFGTGTPVHLQAQEGEPDPKLGQDYTIDLNAKDGSYTFKIKFEDTYLNTLKFNKTISVVYQVIVNEKAPINQPMTNKTWLTYGDNSTKSNESTTETYTFGIPVYKYTEKVLGAQKGLDGVKFSLYTNENCIPESVLKFKANGNDYLYSKDSTDTTETLISSKGGYLNINGLKAGTYYLKEIATLDGYNKLENPIKVVVAQGENGKSVITTDENTQSVERVEVLNNSGSLLPSTGGMGTTLIYLIGGALVLGSGFVLANKKRAKAK